MSLGTATKATPREDRRRARRWREPRRRLRGLVFGGGVVVLSQVAQDSFVEGGEHVELSRGEQVDEVAADVLHVPGRRLLDGGAASRQQADHGAAGVVGVGLT